MSIDLGVPNGGPQGLALGALARPTAGRCSRSQGMQKRAHASAKITLCRKSQNCKMSNEFIWVRENPSRRDGAQSSKRHTFRCKKCAFPTCRHLKGDAKIQKKHLCISSYLIEISEVLPYVQDLVLQPQGRHRNYTLFASNWINFLNGLVLS